MKTTLFFFFGMLLLASCRKNNPNPIQNVDEPFEDNVFKVMLDGEWLTFEFVGAAQSNENEASYILVQAQIDGSGSGGVNLALPMETGTFNMLNPDDGIPSAVFILPNNLAGYSISGTLTITSHNHTTQRVKGTFNFIAKSSFDENVEHSFTNGSFDVKYIY
jgi:hypothetical protein